MASFRHSIDSILQNSQQRSALDPSPAYASSGNPMRFNPMVGFSLAALFTAIFFMASLCVYVRRNCALARRPAAELPPPLFSPLSPQLHLGLDPDTIRSLPAFPFSSDKTSLSSDKLSSECSVCLTDFQPQEVVKVLPGCSHLFHQECIDMWLSSHSTCPVCRSVLVPIRCCCSDNHPIRSLPRLPELAITITDEEQDDQTTQRGGERQHLVAEEESSNKPSSTSPASLKLGRSKSGPAIIPDDNSVPGARGDVDGSLRHVLRRAVSSIGCDSAWK